jgi:hypothetical protein
MQTASLVRLLSRLLVNTLAAPWQAYSPSPCWFTAGTYRRPPRQHLGVGRYKEERNTTPMESAINEFSRGGLAIEALYRTLTL